MDEGSKTVHTGPVSDIRDGRVKGGIARRDALTPEQRSDIAREAAMARWNGDIPQATHSGELRIGAMVIQCSVITDADGNVVRVISESGLTRALGRARSGSAWLDNADPGARMPHFAPPKSLISFLGDDLAKELSQPIKYRAVKGGKVGYGVDARLIPGICEAWLNARDADKLSDQQLRTAERAEILIRGLAQVGIIGLVDEATGYQEVRDRQALQAILDTYLAKTLAAWAKRFPDDFYTEYFRLRDWKWKPVQGRRPVLIAKDTNDLVYARLAPNLLKELEDKNPKDERGRRRAKHHQWLSEDVGHPELEKHLHTVMAFMRASKDWTQFKALMEKGLPRRTRLEDLPLFNQSPSSTEQ